jgi:hypothetical protein
MNKIHRTIVAAAMVAGGSALSAGAAGAAPASIENGRVVLDLLCAARGGSPVFSPYAIARCQEARGGKEFEIEQVVCQGLLDGQFLSGPTFGRPNRTSWACVATTPQ